MLTSFRQNNEVNIQNLKKINKYLIDSYSPESIGIKVLANEVVDIIKNHLNNVITNLNNQAFDMHTSLPTSQIEFIYKLIQNRAEQVLNASSVSTNVENSALKKRNKSNLKIGSPEKLVSAKVMNLVNRSFIAGNENPKSPIQESEKQPARINDLISAANSGQ